MTRTPLSERDRPELVAAIESVAATCDVALGAMHAVMAEPHAEFEYGGPRTWRR